MAPVLPSKVDELNAWPARYSLKVESFSALSANGITKYESSVFQSCGYKWKMIIYPDGDGTGDGKGHISVYLAIAETSSLHAGWEVNATFSFLVFDQICDKYVVMIGTEGRFRNIKTEWGFSNCISLATFKEPSNGYLVNDRCVFGVDVYVIKYHGVGEYMFLSNDIKPYKHKWKISEFTKLKNIVYSEAFTVGNYKWKLLLYPTGDSRQSGQSISLFLVSVDAEGFDCRKKVQAKYSISVRDQTGGAHRSMTSHSTWFTATEPSLGWPAFMALSELKDTKKGFLVGDCCSVEADVSVLHVVDSLT